MPNPSLPLDTYLDAVAKRAGQDPEKECGCPAWVVGCVHYGRVVLYGRYSPCPCPMKSDLPPAGNGKWVVFDLNDSPVDCPILGVKGTHYLVGWRVEGQRFHSQDLAQAEFDRRAEALRLSDAG